MKLSICITTHNHERTISECVNSIIEFINIKDYEIIIVDDHSTDHTYQIIQSFAQKSNIKIFRNDISRSLSYNNNFSAQKASGKYLLFMNPDIIFSNKTDIKFLLKYLSAHSEIGSLACLLKYDDDTIQESFRRFQTVYDFLLRGILGRINQKYTKKFYDNIENKTPFSVDWLLGAFLLIEKTFFFSLNGFDLRYRLYYEDVDLAYRILKAGKKNVLHPATFVIHKYNRASASSIFNRYKFYHIASFVKFKLKTLLS